MFINHLAPSRRNTNFWNRPVWHSSTLNLNITIVCGALVVFQFMAIIIIGESYIERYLFIIWSKKKSYNLVDCNHEH